MPSLSRHIILNRGFLFSSQKLSFNKLQRASIFVNSSSIGFWVHGTLSSFFAPAILTRFTLAVNRYSFIEMKIKWTSQLFMAELLLLKKFQLSRLLGNLVKNNWALEHEKGEAGMSTIPHGQRSRRQRGEGVATAPSQWKPRKAPQNPIPCPIPRYCFCQLPVTVNS